MARTGSRVALGADLVFLIGRDAAGMLAGFALLGGLVTAVAFLALLVGREGIAGEGEGDDQDGEEGGAV